MVRNLQKIALERVAEQDQLIVSLQLAVGAEKHRLPAEFQPRNNGGFVEVIHLHWQNILIGLQNLDLRPREDRALSRMNPHRAGIRITRQQCGKRFGQKRIAGALSDHALPCHGWVQKKATNRHPLGKQPREGIEATAMIPVGMRQNPRADDNAVIRKGRAFPKVSVQPLRVNGIAAVPNEKRTVLQKQNKSHAVAVDRVLLREIQRHDRQHGLADFVRDCRALRREIGMVFQSYELFPHMTVLDNVLLAPTKVQKRPKAEVQQEAEALLDRVGLLAKKNSYPRELSGGQKQRVAIVRALCMHPEILLFDEVTAALDPEMVREVLDVMLDLAKQGKTMIIVTHEMQFARAIANRVIFLDGGKIVEEAAPAEFFERPKTERAQRFLRTFTFDAVK